MAKEVTALRDLIEASPADLSDEQLSDVCSTFFEAEPVPPCCVCGEPLDIAASDAGKTIWACSGDEEAADGTLVRKKGRGVADEHYRLSQFTQYRRGNEWGQEMVRRFRSTSACIATIAEQTGSTPERVAELAPDAFAILQTAYDEAKAGFSPSGETLEQMRRVLHRLKDKTDGT